MGDIVEESCEWVGRKNCLCLFEEPCETGLFTMRFQVLDHLCPDLDEFGSEIFLYASEYENFNVVMRERISERV